MLDSRLDPLVPADAARYRKKMCAREGRGYPTREAVDRRVPLRAEEPDVPAEIVARLATAPSSSAGPATGRSASTAACSTSPATARAT
jgi:hypothetical protein